MQIVMMNNAASPSTAGPRTGSDLTIGTDTMAIEAIRTIKAYSNT